MRVLMVSTGNMAVCSIVPAVAPAIMCCKYQAHIKDAVGGAFRPVGWCSSHVTRGGSLVLDRVGQRTVCMGATPADRSNMLTHSMLTPTNTLGGSACGRASCSCRPLVEGCSPGGRPAGSGGRSSDAAVVLKLTAAAGDADSALAAAAGCMAAPGGYY